MKRKTYRVNKKALREHTIGISLTSEEYKRLKDYCIAREMPIGYLVRCRLADIINPSKADPEQAQNEKDQAEDWKSEIQKKG